MHVAPSRVVVAGNIYGYALLHVAATFERTSIATASISTRAEARELGYM